MWKQRINAQLIELLKPFFWSKDEVPGVGYPHKLRAPDGDPDPAFWVDNSGDAYAHRNIWTRDLTSIGLASDKGRLMFFDGGGIIAPDAVSVREADLHIRHGMLRVEYDTRLKGRTEFWNYAYMLYSTAFWDIVTVLDHWRFYRGGLYSSHYTLADDTATSEVLGTYGKRLGFMFLWPLSGSYSNLHAVAVFCVYSTPFAVALHAGTNVVITSGTGTLSGTTGTDGRFTILFTTNGERVYFENRLGATRKFGVLFIGCREDSPLWDGAL